MTLRISWQTNSTEEADGVTSLNSVEHLLEFDAVTKERHDSSSEVTQHVVETGEAISDHKRANPRKIEIDAFVTNTPLDAPPSSGLGAPTVQSRTVDGVLSFTGEFDRVSDVWTVLLRLQREAIDLTVSTRYQVYENVQLISVSVPREKPEDAVTFSLMLQEVFRASSVLVDAVVPSETRASSRASSAASANSEGTVDSATASENTTSSWASQILDRFN